MAMRRLLLWVLVFQFVGVLSAYGTVTFETPEETFKWWFNQLTARADWRNLLMFYDSKLTEAMKKQSLEGTRVEQYHLALDEYIGNRKFVPDKVDIVGDTATITAKATDGEMMTIEFINENGEWKISKLPVIPSAGVLSAKALVILAVILLLAVIVIKKVFL